MYDAVRVRERQRVEHLAQQPHDVGHRQRALARDARPQRLAGDVRHRVVQRAVGRPRREDRHDMRVLHPRDELDLAPEAIGTHPDRRFAREHLDHDVAVERQIVRHEHARHPTAAELALDAVAVTERTLEGRRERIGHVGIAFGRGGFRIAINLSPGKVWRQEGVLQGVKW